MILIVGGFILLTVMISLYNNTNSIEERKSLKNIMFTISIFSALGFFLIYINIYIEKKENLVNGIIQRTDKFYLSDDTSINEGFYLSHNNKKYLIKSNKENIISKTDYVNIEYTDKTLKDQNGKYGILITNFNCKKHGWDTATGLLIYPGVLTCNVTKEFIINSGDAINMFKKNIHKNKLK